MRRSETKVAKMTLKEYIAFEEAAEVRHEYRDGQLIAMPGTTDLHNEICQNITFAMRHSLKRTDCKVYMENVKVRITHRRHYTYPDVFVTCDKRDLDDIYIKKYPAVIIEVSSPSTRVYDKTDKFLDYRKIKSLRHYLIVGTDQKIVDCYSKRNGSWVSETFVGDKDEVDLDAIGVKLKVGDVYSL